MADAEIVIIAEHVGDLFGRPDQSGGVAVGAGELGDFGPQPLVDPGALFGQRQQPARAGGGMAIGGFAVASLVLQRGGLRQDRFGLGPGLFLGVGQDRPAREAEARRRPAMLDGRGPDTRRHIAHLRV